MELVKSEINGYYCPSDPGEPGAGKRLSVSDLEARFISEFAHGRNVLEIGTGLGVATKALSSTANKVTTVDIDPWVQENVWPNLPDNVDHRYGYIAGFYDMAFIDGSHETGDVIKDITICKHVVVPGGLLLFHDVSMQSVIDGILAAGMTVYETKFGSIGVAWND